MSKLKTLLSDHGLKNGLRDLIDISEKSEKKIAWKCQLHVMQIFGSWYFM